MNNTNDVTDLTEEDLADIRHALDALAIQEDPLKHHEYLLKRLKEGKVELIGLRAEIAALAYLKEAAEKGDQVAAAPNSHAQLSAEMASRYLSMPEPDGINGDDVEGVHPLNERLAAALASIGDAGKKFAADVRKKSKERSRADNDKRWLPPDSLPRVMGLLARALWHDVVKPKLARVPAPSLHPVVRTALMNAPVGKIRRQDDGSIDFGVEGEGEGARRRGHLPPVALLSVGARALGIEGERLRAVVPLAAWCIREAWIRYQQGVPRFEWIALPSGRDVLRNHGFGDNTTEAEIDDAIALLQDLKVGGLPCLHASPPTEDAIEYRHGRGGRPVKRRIIVVGAPLAPQGLDVIYLNAGMTLPPELRFFSPVLNPADAPTVGNRQTYSRQRDFFTLGLGAFFVDRREEYAKRGGVPSRDLRAHLDGAGIYHRSHQSLADRILTAYLSPREPGLFGKGGPVLQETEPGSGVIRFGDDFAEQERVIIGAAERTVDARKRQKRGRDGAAKRSYRPKGDS